MMRRLLVGIDDTDNKTSRGTGFLARKLAKLIEDQSLGTIQGITRHQLFVDSRIPYTSQNSSACLDILTNQEVALTDFARDFLINESAEGSDAGLAVSLYDGVNQELVSWGERAKKEVLTKNEARDLARREGVLLEGLTGTRDGIIGSLAGIGLRKSGEDGRFIWLKGQEIRELSGVHKVEDLMNSLAVDQIIDKTGKLIPMDSDLELSNWVRPVLIKNKVTIIVEESLNSQCHEWKVASKDYIKSISG
jgi:hypothetical protein